MLPRKPVLTLVGSRRTAKSNKSLLNQVVRRIRERRQRTSSPSGALSCCQSARCRYPHLIHCRIHLPPPRIRSFKHNSSHVHLVHFYAHYSCQQVWEQAELVGYRVARKVVWKLAIQCLCGARTCLASDLLSNVPALHLSYYRIQTSLKRLREMHPKTAGISDLFVSLTSKYFCLLFHYVGFPVSPYAKPSSLHWKQMDNINSSFAPVLTSRCPVTLIF